jgi:hypothetical protein
MNKFKLQKPGKEHYMAIYLAPSVDIFALNMALISQNLMLTNENGQTVVTRLSGFFVLIDHQFVN